MRFHGNGKAQFADSGGVYFVVRFVDGVYETDDKTEIELLKRAGYKSQKLAAKKPIERGDQNDG